MRLGGDVESLQYRTDDGLKTLDHKAEGPRPHVAADPEKACMILMPTGCSNTMSETTTPTSWFEDTNPTHAGMTCDARLALINSWCKRQDGKNRFKGEDEKK